MKQLLFEWDKDKANSNAKRHKISFDEAKTVFADPLAGSIPDIEHSYPGESRSITIGMSEYGRLLVVVHCDRKDRIRIISARKTTRKEKTAYEEEY